MARVEVGPGGGFVGTGSSMVLDMLSVSCPDLATRTVWGLWFSYLWWRRGGLKASQEVGYCAERDEMVLHESEGGDTDYHSIPGEEPLPDHCAAKPLLPPALYSFPQPDNTAYLSFRTRLS